MSAPAALRGGVGLVELASLPPAVEGGEPAWLTDGRRSASRWIAEHGFPTRKHEDWRYVDLRPLLESPFPRSVEPNLELRSGDLAGVLPPALGGPKLVFVDGRFAPALSWTRKVPTGVRLVPLSSAVRAGDASLPDLWVPPEGVWLDGFAALNAALAVDGAVLEVAPDVVLDDPVEIVYVALGGEQLSVASPRTVVRIGAGSRATVVETYVGSGGGPSLTNARTQVVLGEHSELEHYRFQAEADEAFHLSSVEVRPGRASRFGSHLLATGSRLGRHELRVVMKEERASVDLDGLYLTGGKQCHDNPVRVEHAAPDCTSQQTYRGIVDGGGHGIFNGHVIVHPGAAGTDAHQVNKNLLLSEQAEVDTRPRLEIFADDVACTHGAAVGQLDPDALFYLRSRGIPEPRAKALLVSGFAQEILRRFRQGPIAGRAEELVTAQLASGQDTETQGQQR